MLYLFMLKIKREILRTSFSILQGKANLQKFWNTTNPFEIKALTFLF
jgi:hypothetical protein